MKSFDKKFLEMLSSHSPPCAEVPAELDRKVLEAAAVLRAKQKRHAIYMRRSMISFFSAAVAALIVVGIYLGTIYSPQSDSAPLSEQKLLELWDLSDLEQELYGLDYTIDSYSTALSSDSGNQSSVEVN